MKLTNWKEETIKFDRSIKEIKMFEHLLPDELYKKATFVLSDTNPRMANMIRIVLEENILCRALYIQRTCCLHSDDVFIRASTDMIINGIQQIPIKQDYVIPENTMLAISVYNNTNSYMSVRAKDIKLYKFIEPKKSEAFDDFVTVMEEIEFNVSDLLCFPEVEIISLMPYKRIEITNISIVEGYGKDDASCFTLVSPIGYGYVKPKEISSTKFEPDTFNFSIESCKIDLKTAFNMAVDECLKFINSVKINLEKHIVESKSQLIYANDFMIVEKIDSNYLYKFNNIPFYVTAVVNYQTYLIDKSIPFISSSGTRTDGKSELKINTSDASKKIIIALDEIINDLNFIRLR